MVFFRSKCLFLISDLSTFDEEYPMCFGNTQLKFFKNSKDNIIIEKIQMVQINKNALLLMLSHIFQSRAVIRADRHITTSHQKRINYVCHIISHPWLTLYVIQKLHFGEDCLVLTDRLIRKRHRQAYRSTMAYGGISDLHSLS